MLILRWTDAVTPEAVRPSGLATKRRKRPNARKSLCQFAVAIHIKAMLTVFATNFIHLAKHLGALSARTIESALYRSLVGPNRLVRVAANSPAAVISIEDQGLITSAARAAFVV